MVGTLAHGVGVDKGSPVAYKDGMSKDDLKWQDPQRLRKTTDRRKRHSHMRFIEEPIGLVVECGAEFGVIPWRQVRAALKRLDK